jgi:hypothetical protein
MYEAHLIHLMHNQSRSNTYHNTHQRHCNSTEIRTLLASPGGPQEGVGGAEKALFVAQLVGGEGHQQVVPGVVDHFAADLNLASV